MTMATAASRPGPVVVQKAVDLTKSDPAEDGANSAAKATAGASATASAPAKYEDDSDGDDGSSLYEEILDGEAAYEYSTDRASERTFCPLRNRTLTDVYS
jgi:hypothetical protein